MKYILFLAMMVCLLCMIIYAAKPNTTGTVVFGLLALAHFVAFLIKVKRNS